MSAIFLACTARVIDLYLANYFHLYRHPQGPVQDRASNPAVFSCAAAGFGMSAAAIGHEQGLASRAETTEIITRTIDYYSRVTPPENRGWLYHFHDLEGRPLFNREVSTIDTALFWHGARQAAARLRSVELINRVNREINKIDRNFMKTGDHYSHGIIWDGTQPSHLGPVWDEYSEGVLIYDLFGEIFMPQRVRVDLPLFAYYYQLCFVLRDDWLDYLHQAVLYQQRQYGYVGVTSTDTKDGYQSLPVDYVSPLALLAVARLEPLCREGLAGKNWSVHSHHLKSGWRSTDRIAIDEGAALLLRHPHR